MAGYYDPNKDYSAAIEAEKAKGSNADQNVIKQLTDERQNKIDDKYGGKEPTMYGSNQTYTQLSGSASSGNSSAQTSINKAVDFANTDGANYFGTNDVYKAAYQAAAAGDWDKVGTLVNQLEYTDAQGRGNLSETNRYMNQLQQLFGYNANDYYRGKYDAVYGEGAWDGGTGTGKPVFNEYSQAMVDAYNQGLRNPQTGAGIPALGGGIAGGGPGGSGALSGVNPGLNLGGLINGSGTSSNVGNAYNPGGMGNYLDQWLQKAQQQQINQVNYGVNTAVAELIRQQQQAQAQFQEQRDQIAVDEAKAKDNQALYAERRGDKGGIGQAQYNAIMNTAAQNRLQVSQAQTQLSTDTARQIAELRAQGEFEKADALLELSQTYLSQLMSLEQWSMEFGLSVAQFNESVRQWKAEYDMAVADLTGYYNGTPTLAYQKTLADQGWAMLSAGMAPTESQLAAMGLTGGQAQDYLTAQRLATQPRGNGGNGGDGTGDSPLSISFKTTDATFKNAQAMYEKGNVNAAIDLLESTYTGGGLNSALASLLDEGEYADYVAKVTNDLSLNNMTAAKDFDRKMYAVSERLAAGHKDSADDLVKSMQKEGLEQWQLDAIVKLYKDRGYTFTYKLG